MALSTSTIHPRDFFHLLKLKFCTQKTITPYFPLLQHLVTTILFSVSMHLTTLGTAYKWNHTVFLLLWLAILLSLLSSRLTILRLVSKFPSFLGWKIFHCMHISHFVYSPISGHLGCFRLLAIVNNVAMNTDVQISVQASAVTHFFWVYTQKWNCWITW